MNRRSGARLDRPSTAHPVSPRPTCLGPAVASTRQRRRRVADPARRPRGGRQDARGGRLGHPDHLARPAARRRGLDPGRQRLARRTTVFPPRLVRDRLSPRRRGRRAPVARRLTTDARRTSPCSTPDHAVASAQPVGPAAVPDGARASRALHDGARRPAAPGRSRVCGTHPYPCPHRRTRGHRLHHPAGPGMVRRRGPHRARRGHSSGPGPGRPALHTRRCPSGGPGGQRGLCRPAAAREAPVAVHRERGGADARDSGPLVPRCRRRRGPDRSGDDWSAGHPTRLRRRCGPVPDPPTHG